MRIARFKTIIDSISKNRNIQIYQIRIGTAAAPVAVRLTAKAQSLIAKVPCVSDAVHFVCAESHRTTEEKKCFFFFCFSFIRYWHICLMKIIIISRVNKCDEEKEEETKKPNWFKSLKPKRKILVWMMMRALALQLAWKINEVQQRETCSHSRIASIYFAACLPQLPALINYEKYSSAVLQWCAGIAQSFFSFALPP